MIHAGILSKSKPWCSGIAATEIDVLSNIDNLLSYQLKNCSIKYPRMNPSELLIEITLRVGIVCTCAVSMYHRQSMKMRSRRWQLRIAWNLERQKCTWHKKIKCWWIESQVRSVAVCELIFDHLFDHCGISGPGRPRTVKKQSWFDKGRKKIICKEASSESES